MLHPSEPECLVRRAVVTCGIDDPKSARIGEHTNAFQANGVSFSDDPHGILDWEGHRSAILQDDSNDIRLNRETGIHFANGKDRPLGVTPVSEIEVTPEG